MKVTPAVLTVLPRNVGDLHGRDHPDHGGGRQWSFGSLTWADLRGHSVRSPLVVRGAAIAATAEVATIGASGAQALIRPAELQRDADGEAVRAGGVRR